MPPAIHLRIARFVFLLALLAATSCTTPEAVRDFTASASQASVQFPPLVRDMTESCIRKQLADRPLSEIADANQQVTGACKEFSDLDPNLLGALKVFTQYLNALNQLASDGVVTYDKEIDGFAANFQAAGKFQESHVKAIKGLAKFLFDAVASGYQRKKLGAAIKAADADIATLTTAFGTIIGSDYDRELRDEELAVRNRYRRAIEGGKNTGTQLLIQERWRQDLTILNGKRRAAKSYQEILGKIRDGHKQLAAQVDHWDAKQLIQILKPYAASLKDLAGDVRAAYFSQISF